MSSDGHGFRIDVDGVPVARVSVGVTHVFVEGRAGFKFGSAAQGNRMEDLENELVYVVLSALGLRRGFCGNWGDADGNRIDGNGVLERSPLDIAIEAVEALERAEQEAKTV